MNKGDPARAAIAAGREVLRRTQQYLRSGENFAIETTLSGTWINRAVDQAITSGFFVRLVYVCLSTPERNVQRVRERVAQGGHSVPDEDVRRRYARSLSNAREVLKVVNEAIFYDNSGPKPKLIFEIRSGHLVHKASELPEWSRSFLSGVSF
jgi:predicted ABC-type ATPase